MSALSRLNRAFDNALALPLDQDSKYILFSDCHRGTGRANDNFLKNEPIYLAALNDYYQRGFVYLELGDGDELWENRSIRAIKEMHHQTFLLHEQFCAQNRMYALYGNHDICKKNPRFKAKYAAPYFCENQACDFALCPGITFYSGIILKDQTNRKDIYLTHGHQPDFLNSTLWRLARILVRYVWRPLEALGIPDPTSAAKNHTKKKKSEAILANWAKTQNHILITGHTHHPMLGSMDSPYFNTGSCVHPGGITGIEIENHCITLVKWHIRTKDDLSLYVAKEILGGPVAVE